MGDAEESDDAKPSDNDPFSGFSERVARLSEAFGFAPQFLDELFKEDDWSLVIKLHALLESVVNQLLAAKLDSPKLATMLTSRRVSMSFRLDMLKALDIVSDNDFRRMESLGQLRNKLVHDIRQTTFKIGSLVDTEDKRKKFFGDYALNELLSTSAFPMPPENARLCVWMSVVNIVALTAEERVKAWDRKVLAAVRVAVRQRIKALAEATPSSPSNHE